MAPEAAVLHLQHMRKHEGACQGVLQRNLFGVSGLFSILSLEQAKCGTFEAAQELKIFMVLK